MKHSKIQTRPIENILGRIRTLRQKGTSEIRLTAKEADQLADSLTQVMTRLVTIQEEIIDALKTTFRKVKLNKRSDCICNEK